MLSHEIFDFSYTLDETLMTQHSFSAINIIEFLYTQCVVIENSH